MVIRKANPECEKEVGEDATTRKTRMSRIPALHHHPLKEKKTRHEEVGETKTTQMVTLPMMKERVIPIPALEHWRRKITKDPRNHRIPDHPGGIRQRRRHPRDPEKEWAPREQPTLFEPYPHNPSSAPLHHGNSPPPKLPNQTPDTTQNSTQTQTSPILEPPRTSPRPPIPRPTPIAHMMTTPPSRCSLHRPCRL